MTVSELIQRLEDFNPDAEVRMMIQRHYPLQSELYGVCPEQSLQRGDSEEEDDDDDPQEEKIVYLVEGSHIAYGVKRAWSEAS